jgi:hypothetical protein
LEPPKIRVKSCDPGLARQNTDNPVRRGKIHSGSISQKKMLRGVSPVLGEMTFDQPDKGKPEDFKFTPRSCSILEEGVEHSNQRQNARVEHLRRIQEYS